jgi:outer membrane protease
MVRLGAYLLAFAMALGVAGPVAAFDSRFDGWIGAGKLDGDSTYTIGGSFSDNEGNRGRYWDPLSELKWPLDVVLVALGGRAEFGDFSVRGEIMKNATGDAGLMEDSDWGIYYDWSGGDPYFSQTTKDIFSTSSTDLDALIVDIRGRYAVWGGERFSTSVGLGLRYQKFSIVASDLHQYSPTYLTYGLDSVFPSDPFAAVVRGPVLDYEVTYTIPFAELAGLYRFGTLLSLEGSLGYSPLVQARDRDDHLLRSKLSEGSDSGSAWLFDLKLRLQATKHWFAAVGVSGLFIDTSGTQKQSYYGGEFAGYQATIDQTLTSSQTCGSLEVGYSF